MHLLESPEIIVALIGLAGTALIWFVRLEGNVRAMRELSQVRLDALKAEIESLSKEDSLIHVRIDNQSIKQEALEEKILIELGYLKVQVAELVGFLKRDK